MGGGRYQEAERIQRRCNGFFAMHREKILAFRAFALPHTSRRSLRAMCCLITMNYLHCGRSSSRPLAVAEILLDRRRMNRKALLLCTLIFTSLTALQAADPISFKEIAMLLRNGENQQFIINDTARRKLLQPLSAAEMETLQSLHASPALMNLLRDPGTVASAQTAAAYAARIEQQKAQALRDQQLAEQAAATARLEQQQQLQQRALAAKDGAAGGAAEGDNRRFVGKPIGLKFTAADGASVDIEKLRGKVVLVDFWATWCGPCMQEVPNVLAAYEKYHSRGFEIVGISFDKDKDTMFRVTKQKGMTWPQYFQDKGGENEIGTRFGIRGIPSMWLVDKKGIVVTTDARGSLDAEVARLLAQ
jgi:thiol-disulfide isomerase/thioredoxin